MSRLKCFMKIVGTWFDVYQNMLRYVSFREGCQFRAALLFVISSQLILVTLLRSASHSKKSKQMTYDELNFFSKLINVAFS